jgi:predicted PurR-regulated permease PerM
MPARSQVRWATMATVLASVAAAALLALALVALRSALLWFFISFFIAAVLNPAVERLSARIPRGLAVAAVVLAVLGILAGFVVIVLPPFLQQVRDLAESAPDLARSLEHQAWFQRLERHLGIGPAIGGSLKSLPDYLAGAASPLLHLVGGVFRFGLATVSIFFLVIFMLAGGPHALEVGLGFMEPPARARLERIGRNVYRATARYALGTTFIALMAGAAAVLTLAIAGVPYFLPLGLLLVVLDLIPFAGAITGGALLTLVTGATVGWLQAFLVLAVFTVYQEIESHVLLPLVHRRTVRVSALGIVIALLVGYELAGLFGVLIAVPVAGALRIVARELLALREERRRQPLPTPDRPRSGSGRPLEPPQPVEH